MRKRFSDKEWMNEQMAKDRGIVEKIDTLLTYQTYVLGRSWNCLCATIANAGNIAPQTLQMSPF